VRRQPDDRDQPAADEEPRERALTENEIAKIWNALPDSDYGRIVKLLLLTGQRREEIAAAVERSRPRRDAHSLPKERTSNKAPARHTIVRFPIDVLSNAGIAIVFSCLAAGTDLVVSALAKRDARPSNHTSVGAVAVA